jgi:hypothetical protein
MPGQPKLVDLDDVKITIVSILACEKQAISLNELENGFLEANGFRIPFQQFGFRTCQDFLASIPDKVQMVRDSASNSLHYKAVVNSAISDLTRLVSGQKSKKKKKSAKNKKIGFNNNNNHRNPMIYNDYFNGGIRNNNSNNNNKNRQYRFNNQNRPHVNTETQLINRVMTHSLSKNSIAKRQQQQQQPLTTSFFGTSNNYNILNQQQQQQQQQLPKKKGNKEPAHLYLQRMLLEDKEVSNYIENAAYFLCEHNVYISHIESAHKMSIRLVSKQFSVSFFFFYFFSIHFNLNLILKGEYERMLKEMNQYYIKNKKGQTTFEPNNICVVYERNKKLFLRAEIQSKVLYNRFVKCYFVDEGYSGLIPTEYLFEMNNDFLKTKFQAISVEIDGFSDYDVDNVAIKEALYIAFYDKEFLAKRTQTNPLTISLFNSNNQNLTQIIANNYQYLKPFKPKAESLFYAYITYQSEESSLTFMKLSGVINEKYNQMTNDLNSFFENENGYKVDFDQIANIDTLKNRVFCAKFNLDNVWYRVQILRDLDKSKVLISFIDYGNKQVISKSDIRFIPEHFNEYIILPPQAFPVTLIVDNPKQEEIIKSYFYDEIIVHVKVIRLSVTGIPSVEILNLKKDEKLATDSTLSKLMTNIAIKNDDDDIEIINFNSLSELNFPSGSHVYVRNVNNPFDFVVNLKEFKQSHLSLMFDIKQFYLNKPNKYMVSKLEPNNIYIYQNEQMDVFRVKFIDIFNENYVSSSYH